MTDQTQLNTSTTEEPADNRPDFVAKQYRLIRVEDGWRLRKERIGVAWKSDNGSICLRPSGVQVIEGDVHLFPSESENVQ